MYALAILKEQNCWPQQRIIAPVDSLIRPFNEQSIAEKLKGLIGLFVSVFVDTCDKFHFSFTQRKDDMKTNRKDQFLGFSNIVIFFSSHKPVMLEITSRIHFFQRIHDKTLDVNVLFYFLLFFFIMLKQSLYICIMVLKIRHIFKSFLLLPLLF